MAPSWCSFWGRGGSRGIGSGPHGRLSSGSEASWPILDRGLMAARGPLPPGPGHRKPRAATWWAGAGNPQREEGWSSRAAKGAWDFDVREDLGARVQITPQGPLQAYVSVLQPHGPLEFFLLVSREVRRAARYKWHFRVWEAGEMERPGGD